MRWVLALGRRRLWSNLLLFVGALLLAVVAGQYCYMGAEQHALQQRWNAINQPGRITPAVGTVKTDPVRLLIPGIGLDDVVVRGTGYEDLLVGLGWLSGTPAPGHGNTVLAGHRDTFFRHVADLHAGDAVFLRQGGENFIYQVVRREIIKPSQTQVLENTAIPQLTLVTCYPTYWIGPAPDRLVVVAALRSTSSVSR